MHLEVTIPVAPIKEGFGRSGALMEDPKRFDWLLSFGECGDSSGQNKAPGSFPEEKYHPHGIDDLITSQIVDLLSKDWAVWVSGRSMSISHSRYNHWRSSRPHKHRSTT